MTLISIYEKTGPNGCNAAVQFDRAAEYPIQVQDPFGPAAANA